MIALLTFLVGLVLGLGAPQEASALTWKMPPQIFNSTNFFNFDLASNPSGEAFTIWTENGSTQLFVSQFSPITHTYGAPVLLYTGSPRDIAVATDATGTALVVWNDGVTGLLLSSYFNGITWTSILPAIATVPNFPFLVTFTLTMDGLGNGLLAWQDQSVVPFPGVVFTSFFSGTTLTWSSPQSIDLPPTGGEFPQTAFSSNGTAAVLWSGPPSVLFVSNFNGTTWSATPTTLSPNGGQGTVGIDAAGNALAVWIDGATGNVMFSRFTGGVWSSALPISIAGTNNGLSFAMNPAGAAVATWVDSSGTGQYSVFNGTSWSIPLPFATDVSFADVSIDTVGNILVVWLNSVNNNILSSFRPAGGSFGSQDLVFTGGTNFISELFAKLSDNRQGFADWSVPGDGTSTLEGSYTIGVSPPQSISGRACNDKFAWQVDHVHIISWTASLDPTVVSYFIRRNGVLIGIVPATKPLIFFDHDRCGGKDRYTVTAVDASGTESLPLEVTIK